MTDVIKFTNPGGDTNHGVVMTNYSEQGGMVEVFWDRFERFNIPPRISWIRLERDRGTATMEIMDSEGINAHWTIPELKQLVANGGEYTEDDRDKWMDKYVLGMRGE